jgi:S-formylglutathione hydrolase FrmB
MILPAPLAESVRQMAQNGGGTGGGAIHIHAMDAGSFLTFAQQNKKAFATVVKDLVRNGALSPRTV